MTKANKLLLTIISTVLLILSYSSSSVAIEEAPDGRPGILVTPTRAVLEGRQRSSVISIANNGTKTGFYTISLSNKRMSEDGRLQTAEKALAGEKFADDIIRISPRRVTLGPGEHQTVRLLVRKPKDLEEGEYRSHLTISASPKQESLSSNEAANPEASTEEAEYKKDDTAGEGANEGISITIQANFGVTIPVIVRHGQLSTAASISSAKYYYDQNKKNHHVKVDMARQGEKSLYGDLRVNHISPSGTRTVVKNLAGVAVYVPNKNRKFDLVLDKISGVDLSKGSFEITYIAKQEDGGEILATRTIKN